MLHTGPKVIGPLDLEKIFIEFLPCRSMVAILVMWHCRAEQILVPPIHGDSTWNLAWIGPSVLEKKMFENGRTTDDGAYLYYEYSLTYETTA